MEEFDMESKSFSGRVEEVTEKSGERGNFFSVKMNDGRIYNFNEKPMMGTWIRGSFTENEYKGTDGAMRKSKWVRMFEIVEDGCRQDPPDMGKMDDFVKATEVKDTMNLVEKMKDCFVEAQSVAEAFDLTFSTEDIRAMAISLFIEKNKRGI